MKTLVKNYTFNAASRQITITNLETLSISQLLIITNVTDNVIIYNFADPTLGGTVSGNVITLDYNTASMSNTDDLQIFIDLPNSMDLESLGNVILDGLAAIVSQLQSVKTSQGIPDTAARVRVNIETGTLPTVTTVSTVSNLSSIGGYGAAPFLMTQTNQGWAALRNKISLS